MPAAPSAAARPDRRHEVALAARDTVGVGMGYLPLGAAFGVLLATSGLAWWWAPVFSVLIYAGSMEFLAIGLVTGGVGLAQVAATTFFVNFRHVFYGLSFPLLKIRSALGRLYGVHALTDEAYALLATKPQHDLTGTRVLATQVICQLYWLTGSTAGALLGARLGLDAEGLGFALTALFVVLTIDAFRAAPDLPTLLVALACAALALAVAPGSMLVIALTAFVLVLIARFALGARRRAATDATAGTAGTGEHHLAVPPAATGDQPGTVRAADQPGTVPAAEERGTHPGPDGGAARPREDQDA